MLLYQTDEFRDLARQVSLSASDFVTESDTVRALPRQSRPPEVVELINSFHRAKQEGFVGWARSKGLRMGRFPTRGQVFLLKAGSHDADGLDGEKKDRGNRIAFIIILPKPNEGNPENQEPHGAITVADESAKATDGKAAPLQQRKEPQTLVMIEREISRPLPGVFSSVKMKVGHGVMLEPREVLHAAEEICVLCIIHRTRVEEVMDPGDDKDWAPSASWIPSATARD